MALILPILEAILAFPIPDGGHIESFNGKLRDELLNLESMTTLGGAKVPTRWWRREYDQVRPHVHWARDRQRLKPRYSRLQLPRW